MDNIQKIYKLVTFLIVSLILWKVVPFLSSIIIILIFAFLFTTVFLQSIDYLERFIKSRVICVLSTLLAVFIGVIWFIGSFLSNLGLQIQLFTDQIKQKDFISNLENLSIKVKGLLPEFLNNIFPENDELILIAQNSLGNLLQKILSFLGSAGNLFFTTFMIIVFTIILLTEYYSFKRTLVQYIPNKYLEVGLRTIYNIEQHISKYLQGQIMAAGSVSILSILGLIILNSYGTNITLIVFIGIIAGIANLIPLVGPFVGMVPAILIAFMNNLGNEIALNHYLFNVIPSPYYIFDIILMFIIVQQIDNNFVTPVVVGESVGLHPMAVMLVLLIGGTLLGPLGMLFAVPVAGVVKVILVELIFISKNSHLL